MNKLLLTVPLATDAQKNLYNAMADAIAIYIDGFSAETDLEEAADAFGEWARRLVGLEAGDGFAGPSLRYDHMTDGRK